MSEPSLYDTVQIPARFRLAVLRVQQLEAADRYQAAYMFGSVARGDATAASDLDVHVLIDRENPCANINHPVINGVKLDLSFLSFEQLATRTEREIARGDRIPMVAESAIVFDKTGALARLRASAQRARPKPCTTADYQGIQFGILHANDKAERLVSTDPIGALLVMHSSLNDVLKTHYQIQGRWQVSDKRLLADLRGWDPVMASLVERLVSTTDVAAKFARWTAVVDHVMAPIGGRQTIADVNCACEVCHHDLAMLASV
jgi:polymorphic toxin system nucleotidyltransferase-like protein